MDKRQTLRYDNLWNWKDCVIKAGYSFLCNSVHLWTVPLSSTLFMADYTYQASGSSWSHLGNNKIKLLEHQRLLSKQAGYVQWDQLSVVIEDSRWQLLYLVVTQFPRKRYSLISVKNCCYCRFFLIYFLLVVQYSVCVLHHYRHYYSFRHDHAIVIVKQPLFTYSQYRFSNSANKLPGSFFLYCIGLKICNC